YTLSADGTAGVCSVLGTADFLKPCCELPALPASAEEAEGYREFVKDLSPQALPWLGPLALRVLTGPRQVRAEAILLPPDNPVLAGLARCLGGDPEPLEPLPVPKKSIASINLHLNKDRWLKEHLTSL